MQLVVPVLRRGKEHSEQRPQEDETEGLDSVVVWAEGNGVPPPSPTHRNMNTHSRHAVGTAMTFIWIHVLQDPVH